MQTINTELCIVDKKINRKLQSIRKLRHTTRKYGSILTIKFNSIQCKPQFQQILYYFFQTHFYEKPEFRNSKRGDLRVDFQTTKENRGARQDQRVEEVTMTNTTC